MAVRTRVGWNPHRLSLFKSSKLSEVYVPGFLAPEAVIRVLNVAKITFTLVWAHGIGGWTGKPRATEDVDVVVMKRHLKKAVAAIVGSIPDLDVDDQSIVARLRDR